MAAAPLRGGGRCQKPINIPSRSGAECPTHSKISARHPSIQSPSRATCGSLPKSSTGEGSQRYRGDAGSLPFGAAQAFNGGVTTDGNEDPAVCNRDGVVTRLRCANCGV